MGKILNFDRLPVKGGDAKKRVEPKEDNGNIDNVVELKRTPEMTLKNLKTRSKKIQEDYVMIEFEFQGTFEKDSFLKKCEKFKMDEVNPLFKDIADAWEIVGNEGKYVDMLDVIQEEVRGVHIDISEIIREMMYGNQGREKS
jgi:hypothetical protein